LLTGEPISAQQGACKTPAESRHENDWSL